MCLRCMMYTIVAEVIVCACFTLISNTSDALEATPIAKEIMLEKLRSGNMGIFSILSDCFFEMNDGVIEFPQQPKPTANHVVISHIIERCAGKSSAKCDPLLDILIVAEHFKTVH